MSAIDDLLKVLSTWPSWKRIVHAPERIDALEKRIAALEGVTRTKGRACPSCGEPTFRISASSTGNTPLGQMGLPDGYECTSCGFKETRLADGV